MKPVRGTARGTSKEMQLPTISSQPLGFVHDDPNKASNTANNPSGHGGGRRAQPRKSPTKPQSRGGTLVTQSIKPVGFPGGIVLSPGYGDQLDGPPGGVSPVQVKGSLRGSPIIKSPTNQKAPQKKTVRSKQLNSLSNGRSPVPDSQSPLPSQKKVLPNISKKSHYMTGGMHDLPPQKSNIVRIFLSSTFSDMKAERNTLAKYAYPQLKNFCQEHGLEFQVVDMRWGVTDEATNDHSVEDLCLKEVRKCQRLSAGPNFVALTGNRYGFQPIRPTILANEFETLLKVVEDLKLPGCETLQQWYKRDDNAVPPEYVLQPINSILKHYGDQTAGNEELRKTASKEWTEISSMIHGVLQEAATKACKDGHLSQENTEQYFISVTEIEIKEGLFQSDTDSVWFSRNMKGLVDNLQTERADRYTDTLEKDGQVVLNESVESLKKNIGNKMQEKVLPINHKHFELPWKPGGVNPSLHAEHAEYCQTMSNDFVQFLKRLIVETLEKGTADVVFDDFRRVEQSAKAEEVSKKKLKKIQQQDGILPFGLNQFDMFKHSMGVQQIIKDIQEVEKSDFDPSFLTITASGVLASEVLHHMSFCSTKCLVFCGRKDELDKMKQMMSTGSRAQPIMVHAPSGSGKTAFMAKVAHSTKSWFGENCVTIVRFLGTSPHSSSVRRVLISIIKQLCTIYKLPVDQRKLFKISSVVLYFQSLLTMLSFSVTSSSSVLTIVLDSVDQLDASNGAHTFTWLPEWCPQNVNIVVSFIPDLYKCLDNAKKHFCKNESTGRFLKLGPLSHSTMTDFIDTHLKTKKKKVPTATLR